MKIDRSSLLTSGVASATVDRVYRALYVYSSGLFELFGELAMQLRDKARRQEVRRTSRVRVTAIFSNILVTVQIPCSVRSLLFSPVL